MSKEERCHSCGMPLEQENEYHPYAACLMFKACGDAETVRANLNGVVSWGVQAEFERAAEQKNADSKTAFDAGVARGIQVERENERLSCAYTDLAFEGIRPGNIGDGVRLLIEKLYRHADYKRGFERYEALRLLNAQQFAELHQRNVSEGTPFDDLIDELVVIRRLQAEKPFPLMQFPDFDDDGDPTEATLDAIVRWEPNFNNPDPWSGLVEFVVSSFRTDYGAIREETGKDGEKLLVFVTGGWSSNEAVLAAVERNYVFYAMRWHSSERGGLVRYHSGLEAA